jgi:GcrA cell cycle regulator
MVWDEETIRNLKDLWTQGLSTAEIGRRLGVSKNAIVGKAHRLDLDARPSPIRRDVAKSQPERQSSPRMGGPTLPPLASAVYPQALPVVGAAPRLHTVVAPPPPPRPVAVAPPAPRPAPQPAPVRTVMQSSPVQPRRSAPSCCWPIGEPGTKSFRFCDDTSVAGKPYCDEHARLAYVRIRDRKEDAA